MAGAALLSVLLPSTVPASPQLAEPDAASLKALTVSFKQDPRLSGPTYGGERWLSPPAFTSSAQEGTEGTVDARVQGVDAKGRAVKVVPEWTAADPKMVTVAPGQRNEFRITVKGPGESKLTVASQGVSKELLIKAKDLGNAIQVEIIQELAEKPRPGGPAADPGAAGTTSSDPGGAPAAPPAPGLRDEKAKNSYALGMEMGKRLKGQFPELDGELVSRGLRDALAGEDKPLFTEGEQKAALAAVQSEVQARRVLARRQLAERNKNDGQAFLASNKAKEGVVTLATGLQYKVLKAGEGRKPTIDDSVVCHYRGTLVDGTEFDSSHKRHLPAAFALKRVIPGWREALQLMPVGSRWQIVVPSNLAYGPKGARGAIGPDATLVFDVELLSIKDKPTATKPRQTPQQSVASDKSPKS
jgi:FKBP-type peptidyl-prolyl cis-trans isomerase